MPTPKPSTILNRSRARDLMKRVRGKPARMSESGWRAIESEVERLLCAVAVDANGHTVDSETVALSLTGLPATGRRGGRR